MEMFLAMNDEAQQMALVAMGLSMIRRRPLRPQRRFFQFVDNSQEPKIIGSDSDPQDDLNDE